MVIKILKGRSFGGLLDYLFDPQGKSPPQEIEARGSPKTKGMNEELLRTRSHEDGKDRTGPIKERLPNDSTEAEPRESRDEAEKGIREQRGELLISNMSGRSKEELREHFEALAALRPEVEVNVLHAILSMPEEDVLSREAKARIVMRFAELKGLDRTMYAAVEHEEHSHTEIHVISSTIDFKGKLPSDSFDYDRGEAIARQLEDEFGLSRNKSSRDTMRRSPTQGEWKQFERTRELSTPLRLQAVVDSTLDRQVTFIDFAERLSRRGVELRLITGDDSDLVGVVYEYEGKFIRGRRLGRGYTWLGLQREWPDQQERKGRMNYDPERDHEAFGRARSGTDGRGRMDESRESEGFAGAVSRDGKADERTERSTGARRNPSRQDDTVGDGSREAIRDDSVGRQGTARRGRQVQRGIEDGIRHPERTGDGDSRRHQAGVPVSTQDTSVVFRRGDGVEREERENGHTMPGNGRDEQRHLQQGQRGGSGSGGENEGASQDFGGNSSQRDRGAGAALQADLQKADEANGRRDNSPPPVRLRRRHGGQRNVVCHATRTDQGDAPLGLGDIADSTKDNNVYSRTDLDTSQPDTGSEASSKSSAVDEVLTRLWGHSATSDGEKGQGSTRPTSVEEHVRGSKKHRNTLEPAAQGQVSERDDESAYHRAPPGAGKDRTGSSPSPSLSSEKQADHSDRERSSGHKVRR
jgi:hypothetical protein